MNHSKLLTDVANELRNLADRIQAAVEGPKDEPIPIEQVRAALAEKSQSGKSAEVRAVLLKFGEDRLSDIDPDKYAALLREAEAL
jgi:hypothetical protein